MAEAVVMPKAGITVETCIISEWLKKTGDTVNVGENLFTYETDKACFECESTASGELLECFYEAGDEVACLTAVCAVGKAGEDVSSLRPKHTTTQAAEQPKVQPVVAAPVTSTASVGTSISPRARGLAERSGADASLATSTGPNGRVIERDVRVLLAEGAPEAKVVSVAMTTTSAVDTTEYEDVTFSNLRRMVAKTMHASLSTMAQLTHHHNFDASGLQTYRAKLKTLTDDRAGITLGDMILFAVIRLLPRYPDLNANMLTESGIRRFKHVNLGVAVNTDRGLMVPTVFHADEKSLLEISLEVKALAAQCRSGSINPDLLQGASFTVSNLGTTNVEMFTPVINPPQTGILGVCGITQRPRTAQDGSIELYPAMGLSLTYDHRAIDGAPASGFANELCRTLENFTSLLAG